MHTFRIQHTLNSLQILLKKKPISNDGKRNIIGALHLGIYNECGHYNFNYTHDMYCDKNVKYFELLRPLLQKMAKQYEADYPVNKVLLLGKNNNEAKI